MLKNQLQIQVQEIHEGLQNLKQMVSKLENIQKTVLGVPVPDESEYGCWDSSIHHIYKECAALLWCSPCSGMKKELQTLREEIKTLASQIQRKLKSEYWWSSLFWVLCTWASRSFHLSTGIELKKGDEDDKYVPINTRMQRTQVRHHLFTGF